MYFHIQLLGLLLIFSFISLIINIPMLLLLADWCARNEYTYKLLPNSAFIVFCVHYPIVVLLRRICILKFSDSSDFIHILLYFACVLVATLLSIGFYCLLERFFPKVKNLLSGNRWEKRYCIYAFSLLYASLSALYIAFIATTPHLSSDSHIRQVQLQMTRCGLHL